MLHSLLCTSSLAATRSSPRQLLAPVQLCTPRASARDTERAAEDQALLLRACELPGSRQRVARMLQYADRVGPDALSGAWRV